MPDGAAAAVSPDDTADAVDEIMLPPFTVPVIVAPADPDPDGSVGPETRPPQPATAMSARHDPVIRVRVTISMISSWDERTSDVQVCVMHRR